MGKAAKFACIFTPLVLSIVSFACLLVVFLGGLNKSATSSQSLYHYKIDTSKFKAKAATGAYMVPGSKLIDNLVHGLIESAKSNNLQDFYEIYLWGYCSGNKGVVTFCSPTKAQYYFNPLEAWSLRDTIADKYTPGAVASPMNVFSRGAKWLFISYVIALCTSGLNVVVGVVAICTRFGPLVTTITSLISTMFTFATVLASTVLFTALVRGWSTALKPYMVDLSMGAAAFSLEWLAVVLSTAATLFWCITTCFCSGRSAHSKRGARDLKLNTGADTSYTGFGSRGYKPLQDQEESLLHDADKQNNEFELKERAKSSSAPFKGREEAYEPFRHTQV